MKIKGIVLLFFVNFCGFSQDINPFYVGHSLVNHTMPYMVQELVKSAGKSSKYGVQIMNGAPLWMNFDDHSKSEGTPYPKAFPDGNFNSLVITEAVPLQNHLTWSDTYGVSNKFYNYVKNNNKGKAVRFYIYESWHCINSGIPSSNSNFPNGCWYDQSANSKTLWHPRLLKDFPLWSGIVSNVREKNPNDKHIWMVPVGQALHRLTTQINNKNLPGISDIREIFQDDIHLNNFGNYFVACVMYATIYGQSPAGLASSFKDQYGVNIAKLPSQAQALVLQQVAWNTVTELSEWTGVSATLTANEEIAEASPIKVYPNPSSDFLNIVISEKGKTHKIVLYNSKGQKFSEISTNDISTINISAWPAGMYYMYCVDTPLKIQKFLKQ